MIVHRERRAAHDRERVRFHSNLNASIGWSAERVERGVSKTTTGKNPTAIGAWRARTRRRRVASRPRCRAVPPNKGQGLDRNCDSTSRGRAPTAIRISRVRTVTLTSMMFMMPMPPTSDETRAMLAGGWVMVSAPAAARLGEIADGEVVLTANGDVVAVAQQVADLLLGAIVRAGGDQRPGRSPKPPSIFRLERGVTAEHGIVVVLPHRRLGSAPAPRRSGKGGLRSFCGARMRAGFAVKTLSTTVCPKMTTLVPPSMSEARAEATAPGRSPDQEVLGRHAARPRGPVGFLADGRSVGARLQAADGARPSGGPSGSPRSAWAGSKAARGPTPRSCCPKHHENVRAPSREGLRDARPAPSPIPRPWQWPPTRQSSSPPAS